MAKIKFDGDEKPIKILPAIKGNHSKYPITLFLGEQTWETHRGKRIVYGGKPIQYYSAISRPRKYKKFEEYNDKEWLSLGALEADERPVMQMVHFNWAADGFRMHILKKEKECKCEYCKNRDDGIGLMSPDYTSIIPIKKDGDIVVKISKKSLESILNSILAFIGKEYGTLIFEISPDGFSYEINNDDLGRSYGTVSLDDDEKYSSTDSIRMGLNKYFVWDAISGMDDTVTMRFQNPVTPMTIESKTHKAILMPMYIG